MAFEADGNGLHVWYGPRQVASEIQGAAGKVRTSGNVKELVIDFSYDQLPAASSNNALNQVIPAKSLILEAQVEVLTAFAGGTSYDIGTEQTDGTDIDTDGIANDILLASLNAAGKRVLLDPNNTDSLSGALIGKVSSTTLDSQIIVIATGTFTAGKARLTIRYIPPSA